MNISDRLAIRRSVSMSTSLLQKAFAAAVSPYSKFLRVERGLEKGGPMRCERTSGLYKRMGGQEFAPHTIAK